MKPAAPDLTEKVRAEFLPLFSRQPGFNVRATIRTDEEKVITFSGWDFKEALEQAEPHLARWAEQHILPHMSNIEVHKGEVAWNVRKE